jgi:hypothetical protein
MIPEQYRRIALSLPDVVEGSHFGHADFRVGGRIFATLWKGDGVVILTPEQQESLVRSDPRTFAPVKGGWGRKGSTTVNLANANAAAVRHAMSLAHANKTTKGAPVRSRRPGSSAHPG